MKTLIVNVLYDLQGAVTCRDMQQCANKDVEEEDNKLVNMDVINAGFKTLKNSPLQTFYE